MARDTILKPGKKRLHNLYKKIRFMIFAFQNKRVAKIVQQVTRRRMSYLGLEALSDLARVAMDNEKKAVAGLIIEAGCALGGSAITLASAKSKHRQLWVYDVFGMIPPPSDRDGHDVQKRYQVIVNGRAAGLGQNRYYGYEDNLYDKVLQNFADFGFNISENNIQLVQGLYEDTLNIEAPVALAHIDCDWYASVLTCLRRIEPYLVDGGTLIIDDYYHWSGCRAAVDEYFEGKDNYHFIKKSRLHIVKKHLKQSVIAMK
jgi:asparagine synthase (glutamine-hydrolysing)